MDSGTNYGKKVMEARIAKGWSRSDLAKVYGKFFHEETISEDTIRMWEDYNKVPKNRKRRAALAKILDLSFVALGVELATGSESLDTKETLKRLDITKAQAILNKYKHQNHASTVSHMLEDILEVVYDVHDELPYSSENRRVSLLWLLCDYQQFIAGLFRDHTRYDEALAYQNKTYVVAKSLVQSTNDRDILPLVLLHRAITYHEMNNFPAAASDLRRALSLKPPSVHLQGAIRSELGHVLAHSATDKAGKNEALTFLDSAGTFLDACKKEPDPYFVKFNEEGWHLNRASSFVGVPVTTLRETEEAFNELALVPVSEERKRRFAYSTYLQARVWFEEGKYETATETALDALAIADEIGSKVNIHRIGNLHADLKATSYGKSTAVAELSVRLFKAEHPEIFA